MNARINQLVKTLLQKDSLEECTLPELQEFADRHPYVGAAQLLLTKKMQTERPDQYEEQLKKTYLFFHNPLWVEHMLNDTGNAQIIAREKQTPALVDEPEDTTEFHAANEPDHQEQQPAISATNPTSVVQQLAQANELTAGAGPAVQQEELLFEPYHTVDYFASQGITYKEEEKPADKFGRQLKSFTEWLKLMKRLPQPQNNLNTDSSAEQKVAKMAESSLKDREVITESMAAVWEKQGNWEKAIEVYSKLSLLEPSKSVYFAAKIEELKNQI